MLLNFGFFAIESGSKKVVVKLKIIFLAKIKKVKYESSMNIFDKEPVSFLLLSKI